VLRRKQRANEDDIKELQAQILEWEKWEKLAKSEHGKFLINQLDMAIEDTLNDEDTRNIYEMDVQAREYFFSSVRSKRQTLKALKDRLLKAEQEKSWRISELARLQPE